MCACQGRGRAEADSFEADTFPFDRIACVNNKFLCTRCFLHVSMCEERDAVLFLLSVGVGVCMSVSVGVFVCVPRVCMCLHVFVCVCTAYLG